MRREVLYQYDLPIEVLDNISDTEEVFNVIFGRSKDKFLIPVLFSNERIFWGYPERETVYKIFELQYVDIVYIYAKFPVATPASITIQTNAGKIAIPNVKDTVEDVRAALLTAAEEIKLCSGVSWMVANQKSILMEECLLKKVSDMDNNMFDELENQQPTASSYSSTKTPYNTSSKSLTSSQPLMASYTTSSHADLFSQFASEGEDDVFEDVDSDIFSEMGVVREPQRGDGVEGENDTRQKTEQTPAMIERIARMVQSTAPEGAEPKEPESDAMIISSHSTSLASEQWHNEGGGDAEILPRGTPWKHMAKGNTKHEPVYAPEDDDSEVYSLTPKTGDSGQILDDDTKILDDDTKILDDDTKTLDDDAKILSGDTKILDDDTKIYPSTPKTGYSGQVFDDDAKIYSSNAKTDETKNYESVTVIEILPPTTQNKATQNNKFASQQKVRLPIPEPKQVIIEEVMLPPRSTSSSPTSMQTSTLVKTPTSSASSSKISLASSASPSKISPASSASPSKPLSASTSVPAPTLPAHKYAPEAITLHPKEGIDAETIDKSLEALKYLRDNKIISEAEYKKRSLSLFETQV